MSSPILSHLWHRTHHLAQLTKSNAGNETVLMGWVAARRDHGNVIFIDLRDREGITQVVFDPSSAPAAHALAEECRNEFVIAVKGVVRHRPNGMVNLQMHTGEIEVLVQEAQILNRSEALPFQIQDRIDANEALRLKYRYLDLRRPHLKKNIMTRIKFIKLMRREMEAKGFLDIETPFLYKSTPEGAREFLVPSRIHAGQFYALPQSPQLFKQVLMVAGFEKYYQVVKCFRDEDLRADRQPEFTQIDCEMSFVDEEQVTANFEEIIANAVSEMIGTKIPFPFPRMKYDDAMEHYGCDKPDTRFDLKLIDLTETVRECKFQVFAQALATGGIVNALCLKGKADRYSRKDLDDLGELAKQHGAKGLAWAKVGAGTGENSWQSPIAKHLGDSLIDSINAKSGASPGDILLFGAGVFATTKAVLSAIRLAIGRQLQLFDPAALNFLWVTHFPLLEKDDKGRFMACHHPFTSPRPDFAHFLDSDPLKVRASAYDLVLNGNEIGGGSVRIHNPDLQAKLFKILGLTEEETRAKFGFLLDALKFGAPPHGGIAFGVDRITMILAGEESIRDVIPFPKTNKGACLMTEAPSPVSLDQLRDLHIRVQQLAEVSKSGATISGADKT